MLHVGLNVRFWHPRAGGVGRYAEELAGELVRTGAVRLTVFASSDTPLPDWASEVRWVVSGVPAAGGSPAASLRRIGAQWGRQALARLDVLHGLANVVAPVARAATVVTLHDLIWLHHPGTMSRADVLAMRATALPSARRADRVIAVSHAAREDIAATAGIDPRRIDVVPHGIRAGDRVPATGAAALRARLDLGDAPVLLSVAQKREHKNLEVLVRALVHLPGYVAVLPGAPTPYEDRLRATAAALGVADRLRLPPWLDEPDLEGLYALASVFALPSLAEGFGLPVLEAMARDVPVACSALSALPEVAGGAAELFDPHDPVAVAAAVERAAARRAELVALGRERCRAMTWERAARATLATYERALA